VKYRAALNSALDMIRTYVKSCLDSATAAASVPASPALSSAPHTAFTLFYGKFRAAAPRMRHLIAETERRKDQGQEYEQLLTDVEQHYLACRWDLRLNRISHFYFYFLGGDGLLKLQEGWQRKKKVERERERLRGKVKG